MLKYRVTHSVALCSNACLEGGWLLSPLLFEGCPHSAALEFSAVLHDLTPPRGVTEGFRLPLIHPPSLPCISGDTRL